MIRRLWGAAGGHMVRLDMTTQPTLVVVYLGAPLTQSQRFGERLFVIGSAHRAFCLREGDIVCPAGRKSPLSSPVHRNVALGAYRVVALSGQDILGARPNYR